jgi:hypothetical protein
VIERFASRTGVVAVAELSSGSGSVVPIGAETLAVFTIEPLAVALTVAVTVNVADAPLFRLMLRLIFPVLPETGVPQLPAATGDTEQLHDGLVRELGNVSVTVAPVTLDGPPFVTVIV